MTAPAIRRVLDLIGASHPLPSAGVTVYATTLAVAAGNPPATCALLAAAVLTGQLTVGWSNDRFDLAADRAVGRTDKPLAGGALSVRAVEVSIAVAVAATVGLSLALGWRAGLTHLGAVACGWIYNRWLKGTAFSAVPYALAFGALPLVATFALAHPVLPAWWVVTAAALLGVSANLTNALPDLERDRRSGFHGLPSRLGAAPSVVIAAVLLLAAGALVAFGPAGGPAVSDWVGMAVIVLMVGGLAPVAWRRARTRVPFYALMAVVPVMLVMLVLDGRHLR